jgi:amino acid adenylation domain-containing protein
MVEIVSHGDLHADAGVPPAVSSPADTAWNWKYHLRELPKYSPIVAQDGKHVGLSFGELRIWVVSNIGSGSVAYNVPLAWRLTGALDEDAFAWSVNQVVSRHTALRTCYRHTDDQLTPCVLEDTLQVVNADLRAIPTTDRENELQRRIQEEIRRPFDLTQDLMLHAAVFRVDDEEYVVVLTVHHIASDGPAMGVVLEELSHFYASAVTGVAPTLPAPRMQSRDFARWQQDSLSEPEKQKQLAYWKQQLKDAPAVLELPSDCERPSAGSFDGGMEYRSLSQELSAAFKALSRRSGVTTFMGLLAAFQTLLFRFSGEPDVVVGAAMTHRNREETAKSIGFFSNMMALRTRMHDDPIFRDLLKRVRGVSLGAYANQDVPFEAVVAELRPDRSHGRNPLFQALINYEDASWHDLRLSGTQAKEFAVHNGTAKFDLSLSVVDHPHGLELGLEYNSGLLDGDTVRRMLASFEMLLRSAVADPLCRVSQLQILHDGDRQELLSRWNQTQQVYRETACIHHLIDEQASKTPEATAVHFNGLSLSYRELNARANKVARYLVRSGVTPETLVGVCAERSFEMVIAILAVLKAGAAYVPLDPAHPQQRSLDIIRDSGMHFLLTYGSESKMPDSPERRVISLETLSATISAESDEDLSLNTTAGSLAYVIYTSGSTGRPKGVQIEHRSVVNFCSSMQGSGIVSHDDVVLAITTATFDISVLELLLPLTLGASVWLASREEASDGRLLIEALERSNASVLQATPTSWRMLLAAGWKGNRRLTALCGGEAMPRALAEELLPRCGALYNMYGPTETCIWSSMQKLNGEEQGSIPIGRPIANTRCYVLDAHSQPVPIGVAGELFIAGAGLSRGYWNAEELTRDRFVVDPFSPEAGMKMYRTGDVVRQRHDGVLEYRSRTDRQVKVRGHRIELGEVESAILRHLRVQQTAVVTTGDPAGGKQLVAYVVVNPCAAIGSCDSSTDGELYSELRSFLRETLPESMVPSAFMTIDALPLTSSGKVDVNALPLLQGRHETKSFAGPRDSTEERVVQIWEECLKVTPVSVNDNFFDLGGHSVLGATMLTRIEREFGKRLSLATLFQAPTVEQLAGILRKDSWSSPWLVQVQAGDPSRKPFFFVHARMGYLALAKELGPDQPVYAVPYDRLFDNQTQRTMQEIATELSAKIREVQPIGPYYLGGVCLAGRVAYAIAREMYRQGDEVALLTIFDAAAPGYEQTSKLAKLQFKAGHLKWHLQRFVHGDRALRRAFVTEMRWHLTNFMWWTGNNLFRWMNRPLPGLLRHQYRLTARAAITDREVIPYPGRVALFRPSDRPRGAHDDPALGWQRIATGGVEIFEVPGDHKHVLLPPNVSTVAEQLRYCLQKAKAA